MKNIREILTGILIVMAPSLARADTIYHFDMLNQAGTAGAFGSANGYAGSFVTNLNPASGDQSRAATLEPHRWVVDVSQPGAPGQTPRAGVDVRVDDAANLSVRVFGFDVLAQFIPDIQSVHGQDGNFDFDITVKNAGAVGMDLSNPVSGSVFAQVGDPANADAGYIFPRFLTATDANADGTINQTTEIYPPIQELGLLPTSSLFLGFVPGDPMLRLIAGFTGVNAYLADGVSFQTGFDLSASLRFTGSETTGGSSVPEPATLGLLTMGLGGAALRRRAALRLTRGLRGC